MNGPLHLEGNGISIESAYHDGLKHGGVIMRKTNLHGEEVVYRGDFVEGK